VNRKPPQCAEIETALGATVTGEADGAIARRVENHLVECDACREEAEELRRLDRAVTSMRARPLAQAHQVAAQQKLRERLADLKTRMVAYSVVSSPIGPILIARSEQGVLLVEYLGRSGAAEAVRILHHHGLEPIEGDQAAPLALELSEYLSGRRASLDWPFDLRLVKSAFHREVLEFTKTIPRGAVVSYGGLATDIGRPRAVRAAAQALRWNPIPIAIPCHRVVGSTGALVGYAGGPTEKKNRLLALEGVPTVRAGRDFRIERKAMYVLAPHEKEYGLPSCPSVDVFPRGGVLFASRSQAESNGLIPCTTCRPDLHPLQV